MITIIYPVAVTDMNFGLIVKAEFEPLTKQQLALKAEGHYLQNCHCRRVHALEAKGLLQQVGPQEPRQRPEVPQHGGWLPARTLAIS